jgi:Subtilase family
MSAWAAKIDELSHLLGVLFVQAAGNIFGTDARPNNPGIHQHLISGNEYPDYLEQAASRVANPAQSLQALTVGSVAGRPWRDDSRRSVATFENSPSAFSRCGLGLWDSIKPDVVEVGGDYARSNDGMRLPRLKRKLLSI